MTEKCLKCKKPIKKDTKGKLAVIINKHGVVCIECVRDYAVRKPESLMNWVFELPCYGFGDYKYTKTTGH